MINRCLFFFLS